MNTFCVCRSAFHVFYGTGLAEQPHWQGKRQMTRVQRVLLGAFGVGLAIVINPIFFCAADGQ